MSSFKEQLAVDAQSTFLNPDEFATQHTIDDRQLWVLVDTDQQGKHIYNAHAPSYSEGVSVRQVIFFVDPIEMGYRPEEDQELIFDGTTFTIATVADEDGLYKITLESYSG